MRKLELFEIQRMLLDVMIEFDSFCREHQLTYYMIGGTALGAQRHKGFIPWDDDIDVGMPREDYEKLLKLNKKIGNTYELRNYHNAKNCDYALTRLYIPGTEIDKPFLRKSKLDKRLYFDIFPLDYVPENAEERHKHKNQIKRLKTILSFVDYKDYQRGPAKSVARKMLSLCLMPFRKLILNSLNNCMTKYGNEGYLCSLASQYSYEKQTFAADVYGQPCDYLFEGHMFKGPQRMDVYLSQLYGSDHMELPPVEKRRPGNNVYFTENA